MGDFPPGDLSVLVESLGRETGLFDDEPVSRWLEYWDAQGRFEEALADIDAIVDEVPVDYYVREALDTAFKVSRRREGRTKAYHWLVLSQVQSRGWIRWWSSQEAFEQRAQSVARDYRERWCEFVMDTSRTKMISGTDDNGIEVGMSRLMYFLIQVGEVELAKTLTMDMVAVFQEEVSQQPLVVPAWARR